MGEGGGNDGYFVVRPASLVRLIEFSPLQVFDNSIPKRIFDRLLYITCSQNWESMGGHFWIKQCLEVRKKTINV